MIGGQRPADSAEACASSSARSGMKTPVVSEGLPTMASNAARVNELKVGTRRVYHRGQVQNRWYGSFLPKRQNGHRLPPGTHRLATDWVIVPPVWTTRRAALRDSGAVVLPKASVDTLSIPLRMYA